MGHLNVLKIIAVSKPKGSLRRALGRLKPPNQQLVIPNALSPGTCIDLGDAGLASIADSMKVFNALSAEHGLDLAWIVATSTTDSFAYLHSRNGRPLRCLELGSSEQFLWERVAGKPEPWEKIAYEGEVVAGSRGREVHLRKRGRWPREGDVGLAPDAMKYANAALEAGKTAAKAGKLDLPPMPADPLMELTYPTDSTRRKNPWKHYGDLGHASITLCPDRYLLWISGCGVDFGSDFVYRLLGLALDAETTLLGQYVIENLLGYRDVKADEADECIDRINRAYPEKSLRDLDRLPHVVMGVNKGRLRIGWRSDDATKFQRDFIPLRSSAKAIGTAVRAAFEKAKRRR